MKETCAGKDSRVATEAKQRRIGHWTLEQKRNWDKYEGMTYLVPPLPTIPRGRADGPRPPGPMILRRPAKDPARFLGGYPPGEIETLPCRQNLREKGANILNSMLAESATK